MGRKSMVKRWRKPKDAGELFRAVQLFLDDALGLVGSSSRTEGGGDVEVELWKTTCQVIVQDTSRTDGVEWIKVRDDEWQAFRAWEKAGRPKAGVPSEN